MANQKLEVKILKVKLIFLQYQRVASAVSVARGKMMDYAKGALNQMVIVRNGHRQVVVLYACAKLHQVQFCGLCPEFPCNELTIKIHWNPNIVEHLADLAKRYYEQSKLIRISE